MTIANLPFVAVEHVNALRDEAIRIEQQRDLLLEALKRLHGVVITKNRAGADWGDLFGEVVVAISEASNIIDEVEAMK